MELLAVLLAICLVPVVLTAVAVAVTARSLRRANRVSPRVVTAAPTTWLLVPERPARLHRRLRRAGVALHGAAELHSGPPARRRAPAPAPSSLSELAGDLERRACAIDAELVVAARATG